ALDDDEPDEDAPDDDGDAFEVAAASAGASAAVPVTGLPAASTTVTPASSPPVIVNSSGSTGETSAAPSAGETATSAGAAGADEDELPEALSPPLAPSSQPATSSSAPAITAAVRRTELSTPLDPRPRSRRADALVQPSVSTFERQNGDHAGGPTGPLVVRRDRAGIVLPRRPFRRATRAISSIGRAADS